MMMARTQSGLGELRLGSGRVEFEGRNPEARKSGRAIVPHASPSLLHGSAFYFVGQVVGQIENHPQHLENQGRVTERVGFEPTVRLPVQRFSSSKILVLAHAT